MTTPFKHLVVLMLENRSFDHMLGFAKIPGLDNLQNQGFSNKDVNGNPVSAACCAHTGLYETDPGHDYCDVNMQMFGTHRPAKGAKPDMSGFVRSYFESIIGVPSSPLDASECPEPALPTHREQDDIDKSHNIMNCFDPARLPVLTGLAEQYAV